jgi:tetratricopeptide (TPR) repeat protein
MSGQNAGEIKSMNIRRTAKSFVQGAAVLFAASLSGAAETVLLAPQPDWVRPAAAPTSNATATGAVYYSMLDSQFRFGTVQTDSYIATRKRANSSDGLRVLGTVSVAWNPGKQSITVHQLKIHRGDTELDLLSNGGEFTVLRREPGLELSMLNGWLTATRQIEGLQVGDEVTFAYTLTTRDPVLEGTAEQLAGGWRAGNPGRVHIRAIWPAQLPMQWKASPLLGEAKQTRTRDLVELTFLVDNLKPAAQPSGAPGRFLDYGEVEFSSFRSWKEISGLLAPLFENAARVDPQSPLRAEVQRIRQSTDDPLERAKAALRLVQKDIRYVYIGMDRGELTPAPIDTTWQRRYGDCKAKTVLLVALLRALDLDAVPVAVSTTRGDGLDQRLPRVGAFDHVLVRSTIGGTAYWLDGTATEDRNLSLPTTPRFRWALPLTRSGSDLEAFLAPLPTDPLVETVTVIDATAGVFAPAKSKVDIVMRGESAVRLHGSLVAADSTSRQKLLESMWRQRGNYAALDSGTFAFDEHNQELRLSLTGLRKLEWNDSWLAVDAIPMGSARNFTREAGPNSDAPYANIYPSYLVAKTEIRLPPNTGKFGSYGSNVDRTLAGNELRRTLTLADGVFRVESSSRSLSAEVPYAEMVESQPALNQLAKEHPNLRLPGNYMPTAQDVAALYASAPGSAKTLRARGELLARRGEAEQPIKDFTEALKSMPDDIDLLLARAQAYLADWQPALALTDFDRVLGKDKTKEAALNGKVQALAALQDFRGAMAAIDQWADGAPLQPQWLLRRARLALDGGEKELAAEVISALRRVAPPFVVEPLAAELLLQQGKETEALALARRMQEESPENSIVWTSSASIMVLAGKRQDARVALDRAISLQPMAQMYPLRASVREIGDLEGKLADLEKFRVPGLPEGEIQRMKGVAQLLAGQSSLAVQSFGESFAASQSAPTIDSLLARASAYAQSGQPNEAAVDITEAQSRARSATARNNFCWSAALYRVAMPQALKVCDEVISLHPDRTHVRDSRAFLLFRMERFKDAIAGYDDAIARDKRLAHSYYGRGIAKRRLGDLAGGDRDLLTARSLAPLTAQRFFDYGVEP